MKKQMDEAEELRKHLRMHNRRKEAKFIFLAIALLALAFVLVFYLGGNNMGNPQGGSGNPGGGDGTQSTAESTVIRNTSEPFGESGASSLPTNVVVHIEETSVSIADQTFDNANALKAFLESIHNDSRTYKLEEKDAILATHDWVIAVFEELRIPLAQE